MRKRHAALCVHDLIHGHPHRITADWVYLRFHGANHGGGDPPQALTAQARRIARYVADGLDLFAYFNNDAYGHAVRGAIALRRHLKGTHPDDLSRGRALEGLLLLKRSRLSGARNAP